MIPRSYSCVELFKYYLLISIKEDFSCRAICDIHTDVFIADKVKCSILGILSVDGLFLFLFLFILINKVWQKYVFILILFSHYKKSSIVWWNSFEPEIWIYRCFGIISIIILSIFISCPFSHACMNQIRCVEVDFLLFCHQTMTCFQARQYFSMVRQILQRELEINTAQLQPLHC